MNTNSLLTRQKEEIFSRQEVLKKIPHHKVTIDLVTYLPPLLLLAVMVLYNSLSDKFFASDFVARGLIFEYYLQAINLTWICVALLLLFSIVNVFLRRKSLIEVASVSRSLQRLSLQNELAFRKDSSSYNFTEMVLSEDVFREADMLLNKINERASVPLRILRFMRLTMFLLVMVGISFSLSVPLSFYLYETQLFAPVSTDLSKVFIIFDLIVAICISCIGFFVAFWERRQVFINPFIYLGAFIGSTIVTLLIALGVPAIIACVCWSVHYIIIATAAILEVVIGVFVFLLQLIIGIFLIGLIIYILIQIFSN